MTGISEVFKRFEKLKADRDAIARNIKKNKDDLADLESDEKHAVEARTVIQEAAQRTQENIEVHFSSLVSMALSTINPSWPEFVVRFVQRRNKTECDLLFKENGHEYKPFEGSGGGAINIADLACRFTYFSLQSPKNRPTFLLDEPLRDLSPGKQSKASQLLKQIKEELDIQIIMVSHQDDINISADKTFYVKKVKGVSHVNT